MSLLLVHDSTNSKLRELECTAAGLLKVDKVDVSALATQATLSSLNGKVTACDTGSISGTVAVSAVSGNVACTHAALPLPSGAATESSLNSLNGKVTACDTGSISGTVAVSAVSGNVACTHAALPLPSGAASESSLASLNGKVTSCDTSALATAAAQSTANSSLATLAGCVSANVVAVSSSAAALSVTNNVVWGTTGAPEAVSNATDQFSDSVDVSTFEKISIFGSSNNFAHELDIQVSPDNSNWFDLTSEFIQVDFANGHFGRVLDAPFKYVRLKSVSSGGGSTDNLWAWIVGKK